MERLTTKKIHKQFCIDANCLVKDKTPIDFLINMTLITFLFLKYIRSYLIKESLKLKQNIKLFN